MAVLLQFNDADSLTVDDLIQATGKYTNYHLLTV